MSQTKLISAPVSKSVVPNQKITEALGNLKSTSNKLKDLRKSLKRLHKADILKLPLTRMLKVHTHLRTNGSKPTVYTPEIVLRGKWLEQSGFPYNDQWVYVLTMDEMLIITPELKPGKDPRSK